MGFNPHHGASRRSAVDYVLIAAALAICIAGLVWAMLG